MRGEVRQRGEIGHGQRTLAAPAQLNWLGAVADTHGDAVRRGAVLEPPLLETLFPLHTNTVAFGILAPGILRHGVGAAINGSTRQLQLHFQRGDQLVTADFLRQQLGRALELGDGQLAHDRQCTCSFCLCAVASMRSMR